MTSLLKQPLDASPPTVSHAKGVFVYDTTGRDYLDGSGGAMTVSIGHGVPEVLAAMQAQAEKVCFTYRTQFTNEPAEVLARVLCELAPGDINNAFFVNSGSEATELCMRTAIQYWKEKRLPEKTHILGRDISYHGMTMGALSMSGHGARRPDYANLLHAFAKAPAPYAYRDASQADGDPTYGARAWDDVINAYGAHRVAAVIVEPIVGAAGGALTPPVGYLKALREICDRHDVLLIVDEVITGMGRTGTWFAYEQDEIVPDMVATAKGMSSGYTPMGGVLFRDRIIEAFVKGGAAAPFGHTFSANPLSAATCLAVVNYMRKQHVLLNVQTRGAQLETGLRDLAAKYPWMTDVRGRGLMWGFEFVSDPVKKTPLPANLHANARFVSHCFDAGLIVYQAGIAPYNNATLLAPPLVITEGETRVLLTRLETALRSFADEFGLSKSATTTPVRSQ